MIIEETRTNKPPVHPLMRNEGNGWIWGCGIGCAAFLLVVVLASIAGYYFVKRSMEEGAVLAREAIREEYTQLEADGKVPAAHKEKYDQFVAAIVREETGISALGLGVIVLSSTLEDGEVSEEEATFIQDFVDFLQKTPDAGFIQVGEFMEKHPEFSNIMNEVNHTRIRQEGDDVADEEVTIIAPEDVDALEEEAPAMEDTVANPDDESMVEESIELEVPAPATTN